MGAIIEKILTVPSLLGFNLLNNDENCLLSTLFRPIHIALDGYNSCIYLFILI